MSSKEPNFPVLVVGKELVGSYGYPKIVEQERCVLCERPSDVAETVEFFKKKGPRTAEILIYNLVKRIRQQEWVETDV